MPVCSEDVLWILPSTVNSAPADPSAAGDRDNVGASVDSGASVGEDNPRASWYAEPIQRTVGQIESMDSESCRWIGQDGRRRTFNADLVLAFRHRSDDPDTVALVEALDREDFDAAFAALPAALRTRPPVHAQQDWVMQTARLAWATGRLGGAEGLISQLDARPLPPCVVAKLPLVWVPPNDATTLTRLRSIAAPEDGLRSPLVRLLRAAAMVHSGRSIEANEILMPLRRQTSRADIRALAIWVSVAAMTPNDFRDQADAWVRNLDEETPVVLSDGPRRLLIRRLSDIGRDSDARRLAVIDRYAWVNVPPP